MGWGKLLFLVPTRHVPLLPTGYSISSFLQMLHPECKELPEPNLLPGQLSHGAVGVKEGRVQWISMAFESVSPPAASPGTVWSTCPACVTFDSWPPSRVRGAALQRGMLRPRGVNVLAHGHPVSVSIKG